MPRKRRAVRLIAVGASLGLLGMLAACGRAPAPEVAPTPQVSTQEEMASDIDYARTFINLGNGYYEQGRYGDAIDQYRRGLEMNPYSDEAHAAIGMAQYNLGKGDLAVASFRRALMLNPRNMIAQNGMAMVSEDAQEQASHLEAAIRYNPNVPELHNNLCYSLVQGGDYERAVEECSESIRLDSANAYARYNLGYAYQRQGRLDEAVEEYAAALRLRPGWARALNNMGLVFYYKSQFGPAIDYYEQAIAADGTEATYHYNLGLAYEAVASRLQTHGGRGASPGAIYGVREPADWRTLYRRAADELRAYLDMRPDASDAADVRARIGELRRRAGGEG